MEISSAVKRLPKTRPATRPVTVKSTASGPARLEDVAQRARVSSMTVSRALRFPEKVSQATRARIAASMDDLGYVPNLVAGGLALSRSVVAAAIVPSIRNSLFASALQGMSGRLRQAGYSLMVGESGFSLDEEERLIERFLSHRPCGLFLHNTSHTRRAKQLIKHAGIPVVETGNFARTPLDSVVSYSNFAASKAMTLHLAERGYRTIAFVSQIVAHNERAFQRRRGYLSALRDLGIAPNGALMAEATGGFEDGARTLSHLLNVCPTIDAIFFSGDVFAIGALFECQRRGWDVPGRIAIAGFDDYEIATQVVPSLTTLAIPRTQIGETAASVLLSRLAGNVTGPVRIDLGFSVVHRQST